MTFEQFRVILLRQLSRERHFSYCACIALRFNVQKAKLEGKDVCMDFLVEKKGGGYQRAQVDAYVQEMRQAYQQMHAACQTAQCQNQELERQCAELQNKLRAAQAEMQALRQQTQQAAQTRQAGVQYPAYPQQPYAPAPYGADRKSTRLNSSH